MSTAFRDIPSNFFEEQWTQDYPQYLSGLSLALFPTTFLEIAVSEIIECFFFFQNWEEIKIEEETEEGKKVESIIRVPAQVFSPQF